MKRTAKGLLAVALVATGVVGCATGDLGGTKWNVMEVVDPDPEDRDALGGVDAATVEFCKDGTLVTTYQNEDGSATENDDAHYTVSGDVITVTYDNGRTQHIAYRMQDGRLRMHSPTFICVLSPIKEVDDDDDD